ncbi:DUF6390 family protein [Gordonia rhizosphera]|uniref:Uncharacterized protein n=1 Tax=Gordonia rhizosphera NBRC 16068 TaxID=1108045 RepID=K6WXY1_9ACTN|nr:DUF6390 family protein [Gordonia rhizosphera]GAB91404.1 hypothetical protein GORHZ_130_00270 [Gordonia rhizosphera NBRC 16068]
MLTTRSGDDPDRPGFADGVRDFARYAFAPNELGYCGPDDFVELMAGDPHRLAERAHEFEGAWTYLVTLADALDDRVPLDPEVVHAYWVGSDLLGQVDSRVLIGNLRRRFRGPATGLLPAITADDDPPAHHNFHVLAVYPWITMLGVDTRTPLSILQSCCIRPGRVERVAGDVVDVSCREMSFDGTGIGWGDAATVSARWRLPGLEMVSKPVVGEHVSLHWDWVCGILGSSDLAQLEAATQRVLDIVNARLSGA